MITMIANLIFFMLFMSGFLIGWIVSAEFTVRKHRSGAIRFKRDMDSDSVCECRFSKNIDDIIASDYIILYVTRE